MKKIILVSVLIFTFSFLQGCDFINNFRYHTVTFQNDDYEKIITAIYYRPGNESNYRWSKNTIYDYIYPGDYFDLSLSEDWYDFKVIMEDDWYSYEILDYDIYVNYDITLYYYIDDKPQIKNRTIKITPKKNQDSPNGNPDSK